jgi:glutathione S-transferase
MNHRLFGAEMSPYSVKVRAYLRYKGIAHDWIPRTGSSQAEYQKHARVPIIPLVVTPEGQSLQDSTPIIDALEALHPEPSVHPDDPVNRFLSALLEEFGDEWGNKWMFHYRWAREVDQIASAGRLARMRDPQADAGGFEAIREQVRARMVERVWFVGSSPATAPLIESSFEQAIARLDAHLRDRPYLFGGRPSFGDFGLWGQLYCAWTDPTPGALIEGRAPHLLDWIHRMLWPRAEGPFENWPALQATLMPFLRESVGGLFAPWTLANEAAVADARDSFAVDLAAGPFTQKPQKYHAKSLAALRARYRAQPADPDLQAVLAEAGCLAMLGD